MAIISYRGKKLFAIVALRVENGNTRTYPKAIPVLLGDSKQY